MISLDVERAIKAALKDLGGKDKRTAGRPEVTASKSIAPRKPASTATVSEAPTGPRSSNLRIKKEFTDLDRDRFRQEGFEYIARFFENSMQELIKRNPAINQRFQRVDATRFTAAVYQHGQKVCKGSVSIASGSFGSGSIEYLMDDNPRHGGMNEGVYVKSDDQTLYFQALGMQSFGQREKEKLSPQGAAEVFWDLFIRPLQ